MAKVTKLSKYVKAKAKAKPKPVKASAPSRRRQDRRAKPTGSKDIDHFIKTSGLDTAREKEIGQHIGYRYDVNLVPDYKRLTPFLKKYMEVMGWDDLNWLEDVHLGYEEGRAAIFDRNVNGWVTVPQGR